MCQQGAHPTKATVRENVQVTTGLNYKTTRYCHYLHHDALTISTPTWRDVAAILSIVSDEAFELPVFSSKIDVEAHSSAWKSKHVRLTNQAET